MFEAPERKGETVTIDARRSSHLSALDGTTRAANEDLPALRRTGRRLFSFEFFPPKTDAGQLALERTIRELAELVAGVRFGDLRRRRFDARQDRSSWCSGSSARRASDRDGPPHLRRGERRTRSAACSTRLVDGRHRERHGAAGRSARRAGQVRADGRRVRLRRRSGRASSASATAASSAWAAPATPKGTSSAATSIRTSATSRPRSTPGLDFVVTQLFFDNRVYFDFVARARAAGINVPIVPGLMPIRTLAGIERMTKLLAAPASRRRCSAELRALPQRRRGGRSRWASPRRPRRPSSCFTAARPGIHFYTLNQSPATRVILTALKTARLA